MSEDTVCYKFQKEPCSRRNLYVDFQKIGLTSIFAPSGYDAYYCNGHCKSHPSVDQKSTNHATILVNKYFSLSIIQWKLIKNVKQ